MKITKKIYAAESDKRGSGTAFYSVTEDELKDYYSDEDTNVWMQALIKDKGFDAIDFDNNLFGSKIIDDVLYICVTDGRHITVDGKSIDPEEALDKYSVSELDGFISHGTDKLIHRYITEYEVYTPDFDKYAIELLRDHVPFDRLVSDYEEFT